MDAHAPQSDSEQLHNSRDPELRSVDQPFDETQQPSATVNQQTDPVIEGMNNGSDSVDQGVDETQQQVAAANQQTGHVIEGTNDGSDSVDQVVDETQQQSNAANQQTDHVIEGMNNGSDSVDQGAEEPQQQVAAANQQTGHVIEGINGYDPIYRRSDPATLQTQNLEALLRNTVLRDPLRRITPIAILHPVLGVVRPNVGLFPRHATEFYALRYPDSDMQRQMLCYLILFYDVQVLADIQDGEDLEEGRRRSALTIYDKPFQAIEILEGILGLDEDRFNQYRYLPQDDPNLRALPAPKRGTTPLAKDGPSKFPRLELEDDKDKPDVVDAKSLKIAFDCLEKAEKARAEKARAEKAEEAAKAKKAKQLQLPSPGSAERDDRARLRRRQCWRSSSIRKTGKILIRRKRIKGKEPMRAPVKEEDVAPTEGVKLSENCPDNSTGNGLENLMLSRVLDPSAGEEPAWPGLGFNDGYPMNPNTSPRSAEN